MKILNLKSKLDVAFNQELYTGPLPSLIYFSLSKEASLSLDPFCQPVHFLQDKPIRVFSFDLPYHTTLDTFSSAIDKWRNNFEQNVDILTPFCEQVVDSIDELISMNLIDPGKIAVAGLSRGAFIACKVAAFHPLIQYILGFAPLTDLSVIKEFKEARHSSTFSLHSIIEKLIGKKLRFYIGNQDTRVDTTKCFEFITALAQCNETHRIKPAFVELFIEPSQGYKGHGTHPHTFESGCNWLSYHLLNQ